MANTNLAHHEQILKLLEKSLVEIGDQHKQAIDALAELQTQSHLACSYLSDAWSQVLNLFVKAEQLRLTRLKFEKQKQ